MNIKCSILLFIVVLAGLWSCKDNDNVFKPVVYTRLNVINTTADTLNFYLNGTRQNNTSSLFPSSASGYLAVPHGLQTYQFKKSGSFSSAVLFSVPETLTDSTSLFVAGESAANVFTTTDSLRADTSPYTTIRFVNASPDAGSLTMGVGDTAKFFNSFAFKSSSKFMNVGSGKKLITIYQSGSATGLKDTTITLTAGNIYTIFAHGSIKGKGNKAIGIGLVTNLENN